jgi:hypothetical protein
MVVVGGSLVGPPLTGGFVLRRGKFYLKARKLCLEIAGSAIAVHRQEMRIVVVWRREYSKSVWEGGVRHNLARAKGLAVVLAKPIVAVNSSCCCCCCSSAAAELAAVAALVDVDVAVAAVVVVAAAAAAAVVAVAAPAVVAGAQALADFVVDHHRMRWTWGMEEEYSYRKVVEEVLHSRQMENLYFDLGNSWMVNTEAAPYNSAAVVQME